MTSLATLFLNKIILSRPSSSVHVLGMCQMTTAAVLGGWSAFGCTGLLFNSIVLLYRRCGCGGRGRRRHQQRGVVSSETQLVMTSNRKQSDRNTIVAISASMRDVDGADEENNILFYQLHPILLNPPSSERCDHHSWASVESNAY